MIHGPRGPRSGERPDLGARQALLDPIPAPESDAGALPRQASGSRPSRKLPYVLHVTARVAATGEVTLDFDNQGTAGAVFHVY